MSKRATKKQVAEVMSVDEVAVRLGIGRNQAYAMVWCKQIPALRFGRRWLIPRVAFERMLAEGKVAA